MLHNEIVSILQVYNVRVPEPKKVEEDFDDLDLG